MAIRKKYEDSLIVGGSPEENLEKALQSLQKAGFKKVRREGSLLRLKGEWKPLVGTLYGDILLSMSPQGANTQIDIVISAAVDNAYALFNSPGERIKTKFLEEFSLLSEAPETKGPKNTTSKLLDLEELRSQGLITEEEYKQGRLRIISGE